MDELDRRRFLGGAALGAVATLLDRSSAAAPRASSERAAGAGFRGTLCLFSKHLPHMDARQLGRAVAALGFGGIDLTVRPGGHVAPDRAPTDLAPFVAVLRDAGLSVPMLTTGLVSADDPTARPLLDAAGRLGIPRFKPGYYRYRFVDVREELEEAAAALRPLAELSARCGVELGFHNHAGYVGASLWDIARVIDTLDPHWTGYYFDVRHATVEGGDAGWRAALNLVTPRLKMVAIKDFFWERAEGGWRQRHCPLGQGMVDWPGFFAGLARGGFAGPISLHLEYDVPGATPEAKQEATLAAAARDLAFLKARLDEAYAAGGASV